MLVKKIYIIVPSARLESPVKGAIALANELIKTCSVEFVVIKKSEFSSNLLNSKIKFRCLAEEGNLVNRLYKFRNLLLDNGSRESIVCISFCLSADFYNSFNRKVSLTISSVRGNLPKVYKSNYGFIGWFISYLHLKRLKKIDYVISMTHSMSKMVESYILKKSLVIGNFIDEGSLEFFRRKNKNKNAYRFIYSGSLIDAKQPKLLLLAIAELIKSGIEVRLDIFGDGPLDPELKDLKSRLNLDNIFFHGFVLNPFDEIAKADVMIIPSLSEGVSRAALEALYLGVPCIMRDVDGNSELISSGVNGELFVNNDELSELMINTAKYSRSKELFRSILTPYNFRQKIASDEYLNIISKH